MDRQPDIVDKLHDLEEKGMYALTWESLLGVAASKWRDFMFVLAARAPNDPRIVQLLPPIAAAPRSTAIPIKP
jgi:hypothetical protein